MQLLDKTHFCRLNGPNHSFSLFITLQSKIIKLKVQKKADKRDEELLEGDSPSGAEDGGIWSSITNTFGGSRITLKRHGVAVQVRALNQAGLKITSIADVTPIPHNGCRPPKKRRV